MTHSIFSSSFASTPTGISAANFAYIRNLLLREAAISLEDGKEYLVETRLASVGAKHGFASVNELVEQLSRHGLKNASLQEAVIDALTTNETLFFRDLHPFDALRQEILPALRTSRANTRRLNIWSAACSTGQEPYSIALLLAEEFPELVSSWNIQIYATDLSTSVLDRAREGVYQQFEVNRGMPAKLLVKHFSQEAGLWRINERIRRMVRFEQLNLIRAWPHLPSFDLVFMRNVLIYFETDTRREILRRVRQHMAPDALLALGNAETAVTLDAAFTPVSKGRATFYGLV